MWNLYFTSALVLFVVQIFGYYRQHRALDVDMVIGSIGFALAAPIIVLGYLVIGIYFAFKKLGKDK